jgi:voltage-gated potassium channel
MYFILSMMEKSNRDKRIIKGLSEDGLGKKLKGTLKTLGLLCGLHVGSMMYFEGLSFIDALWLTTTTAATVGYGDLSAHTVLGRIATMTLMYVAGIAVMAQAVSTVFEYKQDKREKILNGKWKWDMENHIVIFNTPKNNPEQYFINLVKEFRNSTLINAQNPVLLVGEGFQNGISDDLKKLHVAHVNYPVTSVHSFNHASLAKASTVILLASDEDNLLSDSITYDLLSRIQGVNPNARIVAEAVSDDNKQRFLNSGAHHVIRPIRSYPELLARTVLAPGSEVVIENIFNSHGDECIRHDMPLAGKWKEIASKVIELGAGTPLAYIDNNGKVISNPDPDMDVHGTALLILASQHSIRSHKHLKLQSALTHKI